MTAAAVPPAITAVKQTAEMTIFARIEAVPDLRCVHKNAEMLNPQAVDVVASLTAQDHRYR